MKSKESNFKKNEDRLKRKIIDRLIHKVELLPQGFRLYDFVGENQFLKEPARASSGLSASVRDDFLGSGSKW